MPFSRLLKQIVFDSGKTSKEIIEECKKRGKNIDKGYFSKLLNGKVAAPSEELARLLAEICNYDERKLVLECYIDKAPKEVFEAMASIKEIVILSTLHILKDAANQETLNEIKETVRKEPLADFIIQILETKDTLIDNSEKNFDADLESNDIALKLKEPVSIIIKDNGMEPLIRAGMKVSFKIEEQYSVNDLLLIKIKKTEEIKVRHILNENKKIQLLPLNKNYKIEEYNPTDVIILGRVNKIITEL